MVSSWPSSRHPQSPSSTVSLQYRARQLRRERHKTIGVMRKNNRSAPACHPSFPSSLKQRREMTVFVVAYTPLSSSPSSRSTEGHNSNKRCLSNTVCNFKSFRNLGDPDFSVTFSQKYRTSALSQDYIIFPRKIPRSPDSRQNCFSPETGI